MCSIEDTVQEVSDLTSEVLNQLISKWSSMYNVTDEMKTKGLKQFIVVLKDYYDDMLASEEEKKNALLQKVQEKYDEAAVLEKALNVDVLSSINSNIPVLELINELNATMKQFEELKQKRLAQWFELKKKEQELCSAMGLSRMSVSVAIPSEEDIEKIDHYIFMLEEEKLRRFEEYKEKRDTIIGYLEELKVPLLNKTETRLLQGLDEEFPLTAESLENLKRTEKCLKNQYECAKNKAEYMLSNLKKLWQRIDVSEEEQKQFLETHQGVSAPVLDEISDELERCEAVKKEMIKPLIKKLTIEIEGMCDHLRYTEEQKKSVLPYDSSYCSEDVLTMYELELEKLTIIYDEQQEIISLAEKQMEVWNRMAHLLEVAKDKTRLFNNRGGQLLKEEKERKTIEQTLPKVTKQLIQVLEDYQAKKKSPFLYYGKDLLKKISHEWNEYLSNKEAKKPTKKNQFEVESGAASLRKRKTPGTPRSETKRLRVASSCLNLNSTSDSACSTTLAASKAHCINLSDKIQTPIKPFPAEIAPVADSYTVFQEEFEEKKVSMMTPKSSRKALKEVNSPLFTVGTGTAGKRVTRSLARSKLPCAVTPHRAGATPRSVTPATTTPRRATPSRVTPAKTGFNFSLTPAANRYRLHL